MKKIMRNSAILLIIMIFVLTLSSTILATTPEEILDAMGEHKVDDTTGVSTVGGQIVSIITTVGIVLAVIVLVILGIKYMIGSASEKAEYKKTMIPYLVGAILIFAASGIVKAIFAMAGGITF